MDEKLKGMVRIKDGPNGNNSDKVKVALSEKSSDDEVVEEVYASATKEEIDGIVSSIEDQKAKGNEALTLGEYAQAVLHYTMALDRAADLPDATSVTEAIGMFPKVGPSRKGLERWVRCRTTRPDLRQGHFPKGPGVARHGTLRGGDQISGISTEAGTEE